MSACPNPLFAKADTAPPPPPPSGAGGGLGALVALFGGTQGLLIDPDDLGSLWQDAAGTVPAAIDGLVRRADDKSGNGRHLVAPSDATSPTLREIGGYRCLEYDGVGDQMQAIFAVAQPWERISALRQLSWTAGDYLFGEVANGNSGITYCRDQNPEIGIWDGAGGIDGNEGAVVGADAVVTEHHDSFSSYLRINRNTPIAGNSGVAVPGGITVAKGDPSGGFGHFRLYGLMMISRALTGGEITIVENAMAANCLAVLA